MKKRVIPAKNIQYTEYTKDRTHTNKRRRRIPTPQPNTSITHIKKKKSNLISNLITPFNNPPLSPPNPSLFGYVLAPPYLPYPPPYFRILNKLPTGVWDDPQKSRFGLLHTRNGKLRFLCIQERRQLV